MREQYGTKLMTKPEGMLRQVIFPELAMMDVKTGDGRLLDSAGRGTRDLPLTIYAQFTNLGGHDGSVIVGALHEVTFEDGVASGSGWLLDDDNGRQLVTYIKTGSLTGNSVDLAEVRAQYEWDEENDDISIRFVEWKLAATTFVGKPAFGTARGELLEDEELVASWMSETDPIVIDLPLSTNIVLHEDEITADAAPRPPWEMFHVKESEEKQKILVGEEVDGWIPVWGHLALWDSCHDGVEGRCQRVPRPDDNYASYNKPGVLTTKGMVGTGPIFLREGHKRAKNGDYIDGYGGTENAWADVRITVGRLGPWLSGYVRPGADSEAVLVGRASRISGHWKGARLKAVVSVNAEAFDVPGDGFAIDADGHVSELVASFPECDDFDDPEVIEDAITNALRKHRTELKLAVQDMDD